MQHTKLILPLFVVITLLCGCMQESATGGCRLSEQGTKQGDYTCNHDACDISGTVICDYQNPNARVTFRKSGSNYQSGWLALDTNNDGALEGFQFQKYHIGNSCYYLSSTSIKNIINLIGRTPEGYYIGFWLNQYCYNSQISRGSLVLVEVTAQTTATYYVYTAGSSEAVTTPYPVSEYAGKETYSQPLYSCIFDMKKGATTLEHIEYKQNYIGNTTTSKYSLVENEGVTFGTQFINYISYDCGPCGECEIGKKECIDTTSIKECKSDTSGCGKWESKTIMENYICENGVEKKCDDGDICTDDKRPSSQTQCSHPPIENCCKTVIECNDNNECTADKCSNNQCSHTIDTGCCIPSCSPNYDCVNQQCVLKAGCRYDNPKCGQDTICNLNTNSCVPCNDNNICTQDTRPASESNCIFTQIQGCCLQDSECNDNNPCTTNKCIYNQCAYSPISNCCNPSCSSDQECIGNQCKLKPGCVYSNPSCGQDTICNTNTNACVPCNDNNVCTQDTRPTSSQYCIFTPIQNCCTSNSDCNDGNICTTDTCNLNLNRCVFSPIANCCTPSCDSNNECENGVCVLKSGCKYSNPSCTLPQSCDTVNNQCVCPTTSDYCSAAEFGNQKCMNNQVWECKKDSSGICYKWILVVSCGGDQICA